MPYAPGVRYDASPLYEGLASAGRSIANSRNAKEDRKLRREEMNQRYYDQEADRGFRYYEADQRKKAHEDDMKLRGSFNIEDIAGAPGSKIIMNPGTGQFQVLQGGKVQPENFQAQPITDPSNGSTIGYYFGGKTHFNGQGGYFGNMMGGQGGSSAPPTVGEMTSPSTPDERRARAQQLEDEIRRNPASAGKPSNFDRQGETRQQALERLRGSLQGPTAGAPAPQGSAPAAPAIDMNDTPLPQGAGAPTGPSVFPGAAQPPTPTVQAPSAGAGSRGARVRVIAPDGTVGTIWGDQLEAALGAGYRRAE